MKTLTVKLPEELAARLGRAAQRRGMTKSGFIREAIASHVANGGAVAVVSCYDLATDLAGSFSGPTDLSINQKYMDGLGQ